MATRKQNYHRDYQQNEIQNAVDQNLSSAPETPKEGQFYWNTSTKKDMIYNGSNWVDRTSQGKTYTFTSPLSVDANDEVSITLTASDIPDISASYIATTQKGVANGVASLDTNGKVPTAQLPSFVDDVIDSYIVSGATALTSGWLSDTDGGTAFTPETGKIYVVLSTGEYLNKTYRWSGSTYVEISASPAQATESSAGIAAIATQSEVTTGTNDTKFVTPLKLTTHTANMAKVMTATNPALTAVGGQCTWTITNSLNNGDVGIFVKNTTTNEYEDCYYEATSSNVIIKINGGDITAGKYKAIIIG